MSLLSEHPEGGDKEQEKKRESSLERTSHFVVQWKPFVATRSKIKEGLVKLRNCFGAVCGIEWYAFATLGVLTAFLSFLMDLSVTMLLGAHRWLYEELEGSVLLQFLCWTLYPACLCALASTFSNSICPFSTGSGIPEVRTMLAGVEMPQYLSLTNMFTKFVGLICALAAGSTVFLGKVGPFVHLSTMLAAYLDNLCSLIQGKKEEERKETPEMLVVGAAVGVASCFGAPISGVLFSVEVMCSHFPLRHYSPCFFAAACGALTFRLFSVWSGDRETLQALFKTNFPAALPFYPLEIVLFAFLGLLCGLLGCCFLSCHRRMLRVTKTCPLFVKMLATEKGLYSALVVFLLASLTFPYSAGQFMASKYSTKQLLTSLLDNRRWSSGSQNTTALPESPLEWSSSGMPVFLSLAFFLLMKMWMLILACTLPLPAGYFMPVFILGAAVGRFLAEMLLLGSSAGVVSEQLWTTVHPGVYALAGAAALSGAVTHTLSPALLAVELTGHFTHAVPILLSTLLANALTRFRNRPSFYDAISISKRLPHLPSLLKAYPRISTATLKDVMDRDFLYLVKSAGPEDVRRVLRTGTEPHVPVVESHEGQTLLGFVLRSELLVFLSFCKIQQPAEEFCDVHQVTYLLSPHSTVEQAYSTLSLLETRTLFVTDKGRLVGQLTWSKMKKILEELVKDI